MESDREKLVTCQLCHGDGRIWDNQDGCDCPDCEGNCFIPKAGVIHQIQARIALYRWECAA
jgi:hypothetical protein